MKTEFEAEIEKSLLPSTRALPVMDMKQRLNRVRPGRNFMEEKDILEAYDRIKEESAAAHDGYRAALIFSAILDELSKADDLSPEQFTAGVASAASLLHQPGEPGKEAKI